MGHAGAHGLGGLIATDQHRPVVRLLRPAARIRQSPAGMDAPAPGWPMALGLPRLLPHLDAAAAQGPRLDPLTFWPSVRPRARAAVAKR
jgi:hypothetical protein